MTPGNAPCQHVDGEHCDKCFTPDNGCHPPLRKTTMPLCEHGMNPCCDVCDLCRIYETLRSHAEHIRDARQGVAILTTHKNYQIDENRKASRRLDEAFDVINSVTDSNENLLNQMQDLRNEISAQRISQEKLRSDCEQAFLSKTECESDYDERITDIENMSIEQRLFSFESMNIKKRLLNLEQNEKNATETEKPHKCPVCLNKPLQELKITRTESGNDKLVIECHACNGTGVLWK